MACLREGWRTPAFLERGPREPSGVFSSPNIRWFPGVSLRCPHLGLNVRPCVFGPHTPLGWPFWWLGAFHSITHIVVVRSTVEVLRVATGRVIATMEAIERRRVNATSQEKRYPVSLYRFALYFQEPIAATCSASPGPTGLAGPNFHV